MSGKMLHVYTKRFLMGTIPSYSMICLNCLSILFRDATMWVCLKIQGQKAILMASNPFPITYRCFVGAHHCQKHPNMIGQKTLRMFLNN